MTARRLTTLALTAALAAGCGHSAHGPAELVVGAPGGVESTLLADIYTGALRSYGFPTRTEQTPDPLSALDSGNVLVVPGLTGRVLQRFQPGAGPRADAQVYRAMIGALPEGISAGDYATAAEDKPALAVASATVKEWGASDLGVLANHCDGLTVGAVEHAVTPTSVGRCTLPETREFADDAALFAAVKSGEVTAAWTTTADPAVPADLMVLTDAKPALVQAENVVPLYRRNALSTLQLQAVNEVAGVLDTAALVDMRRQVQAGADPQAVADAWLGEHPLGR